MNIQRLNEIIEPSIASLGFEYVGCEYIPQGRRVLLRIYIDKPSGVNIDDCAVVSRQVSAVLDVEDPVEGMYTLEVSSPGAKRRLFTLAQCQQFIGARIKIKLRTMIENRKNFIGSLLRVEDDQIIMLVDDIEWKFAFSNVEKAHLEPDDE